MKRAGLGVMEEDLDSSLPSGAWYGVLGRATCGR